MIANIPVSVSENWRALCKAIILQYFQPMVEWVQGVPNLRIASVGRKAGKERLVLIPQRDHRRAG